jgi:hypothetical protein
MPRAPVRGLHAAAGGVRDRPGAFRVIDRETGSRLKLVGKRLSIISEYDGG